MILISGAVCAASREVSLTVTVSSSSSSHGGSDETFEAGDTIYVHLAITNDESDVNITPDDDIDVIIDIDGEKLYDETQNLGSNLAPGQTDYIVLSSSDFIDEWKYNLRAYECKDDIEVEARVSGDVDSQTDGARFTIEEAGSNDILSISLDPEQPTADDELLITVVDDDGDEVDNAKVKITELGTDAEWDKSDDVWEDRTDNGEVSLIMSKKKFSKPKGIYQVDAYLDGYCKDTITFEISKKLVLTGPFPDKPQAGNSFTMKVTDEAGNALRFIRVVISPDMHTATSDSDGYAKFTINNPGSYTAAAASVDYDDAIPISLIVYEMPSLSIGVSPTNPMVGETVTLTVTADGATVSGASLSVTLPTGTEKSFTSSSSGRVAYTAQYPGYHSIDATKENHDSGSSSFTVLDTLNVVVPDLASKQAGDEVSVIVKDSSGNPVSGAMVSVLGTAIAGSTGSSGQYKFNLPKTGTYTLHVSKDSYTPKDIPLNSLGALILQLSSKNVGVGEIVKVTVMDDSAMKVYGNIQITKPDGTRDTVIKDEYDYIPHEPGTYAIIVSKENYASASDTIEVTLSSIIFELTLEKDTLKIMATSEGEPASDVTITVTTPTGAHKEVVTDNDGIGLLKADENGRYSVTTNDPSYESGTVTIEKQGISSYIWWIILAIILVLFFILVVGAGIFHWHFKKKGKVIKVGGKKSSLG
ncbi:MAG: carboxypeptidase regulatory-like domain-containing protein [Methanobacteriota archaeon]